MLKTITQAELQSIYNYNKLTGNFTRLKKGKFPIGSIVGTVNKKGYIRLHIKGRAYLAHRLAWLYEYGKFPNDCIDHIDGNKKNNKMCNLRDVCIADNQKNQPLHTRNKSGTAGVIWERNRWKVGIGVNGKTKFIGTYINKEDAIEARLSAEVLYGYHKNHGRIQGVRNGTAS